MPDVITSTKNETVKFVEKLKRGRNRRSTGSILVEGPNGFGEAMGAGHLPTLVLVTADDDATRNSLVDEPGVDIHVVSQHVLDSVADAAHPRSPIAVMPRPADATIRHHNTIVLVGVSDPGNAGTIIRSAAAFGWDVAYTRDCVDMWSPKALRSGTGAHFRTRFIPIELDDDVDQLSSHTIVATVVAGGRRDVTGPAPYALLVGSEAHGLSAGQVSLASAVLTIDMVDSAESLNVSVASAIAMHMLWERSMPNGAG